MITISGDYIQINNQSAAAIEKFYTAVAVDHLEINPRLRTEEFYQRQRRKPQEEVLSEKEFVPMEQFVKKVTHDELKEQEEAMRDEEEYETLIEAFIRSKMHEAYDKYSNHKPRDFSFTMDLVE